MLNRGKSTFNRPVRLQDVADAAGTSLATASLAMNGKGRVSPVTQQRILRIARSMGFEAHPSARLLATGHRSAHVGIFTQDLDLGVVTKKLQLLQGILFEKGFNASIYSGGDDRGGRVADHAGLLRDLRQQRPLAIICHNTQHFDEAMLEEMRTYAASGGHVVTFDFASVLPCDQVIFDRADSADQAVTFLLQQGHRQIGFAMSGIHHNNVRISGLRHAFRRFGIEVQEQLLFDCADESSPEAVGQMLAQQFLQREQRPTALCIPDDVVAASFIAALYRKGVRVPQELSVVSHDDLPIAAHNFIPITTIAQPLETIARKTAELLVSRARHGYAGPPRTIRLRGELVVRQSTRTIDSLKYFYGTR